MLHKIIYLYFINYINSIICHIIYYLCVIKNEVITIKRYTIMNTKEIEIGLRYRVSGDLANGRYADGTPRISHDDVVRVIKRITDTHVILECGRRFIINDNLKIEKF